jgi:2-methylcitrate dehydratase PrpD
MPTAAQRLSDFVLSLSYDEIPTETIEAAKLHLLDTLGCGLAAHGVDVAVEGRAAMDAHGGEPEATVIGLVRGLPAPSSAFANAMLCHGLDFDDTHAGSVSHISVVVGPASMAVAEKHRATGRELVVSLVGGNEVVARIGMAAAGAFHARGFHPTAICGIFGGAAAACRLGGASLEATTSAFGIAGSFAGGLFAYLDEGTATKPMHPAWAAHGALLAADLAGRGAEGPSTVFEGRFGLYHAFINAEPGAIDLDAQLADLGERWETPRIAYKPYPACHFIHGSLGATASLLGAVRPEEVEDIEVTVPAAAVALVLEPAASKIAPRTDYEAKFSLQYSTAAMLVAGRVDVRTYREPAIRDEAVLDLASRVRYVVSTYPTSPAAFPGGVRITTRDGRVLEAEQPYQRGAPENPMTPDEVVAKYRSNASLVLGNADVDALERSVLALEHARDVRQTLSPLRRAAAAS